MRDDIRGLRGDNLSFARFVSGICFLTSAVLTFQ